MGNGGSSVDLAAILPYFNAGVITIILALFVTDKISNNSERNYLRQQTQAQAKVISEMLPIFSRLTETLPEVIQALRNTRTPQP